MLECVKYRILVTAIGLSRLPKQCHYYTFLKFFFRFFSLFQRPFISDNVKGTIKEASNCFLILSNKSLKIRYANFFRSFPALYWDKFVKKRVRQKFSENFDFDAISNILGMEKSAIQQDDSENKGIVSLYVF